MPNRSLAGVATAKAGLAPKRLPFAELDDEVLMAHAIFPFRQGTSFYRNSWAGSVERIK
ncbi:hypothetical protein BN77_p11394 [Rhizobium mesoamericanum STM3625]|uniref:Uncharacterized protein n=1 Tax=Rhizobium mesoamericanum STM3625 TaxID=1211777 RepID=K0Q5N0_9HYPH|nr:hypothetical protein BN77_p11394 [Rhizobium mesoamericanum STM3625]